jgi:hypothetical protein
MTASSREPTDGDESTQSGCRASRGSIEVVDRYRTRAVAELRQMTYGETGHSDATVIRPGEVAGNMNEDAGGHRSVKIGNSSAKRD